MPASEDRDGEDANKGNKDIEIKEKKSELDRDRGEPT